MSNDRRLMPYTQRWALLSLAGDTVPTAGITDQTWASLTKRGLVIETPDGRHKLTQDGIAILDELREGLRPPGARIRPRRHRNY